MSVLHKTQLQLEMMFGIHVFSLFSQGKSHLRRMTQSRTV